MRRRRRTRAMRKNDDAEFIRDTFYLSLKPKELLPIDEWVDGGNIMLPSNTAEPGTYSLERTPYQRGILRALSPDDPTQVVIICCGSQLGKTTIELCTMNYSISENPSPIAFAFSDDGNLKNFVKNKFDPMLNANPKIKILLKSEGRSSADSMSSKQFPGGFLKFLSGKSESSMRSDSVKLIIADEVDGMGTTKGGDVLSLLMKRTTTYGDNRKICMSSTPLNDGVIFSYLEDSTYNKYFVRCPHCGEYMLFELDNFRWKSNGTGIEDAYMECPHCQAVIHNEDKLWMMDPKNGAEWRATNPKASPIKQGFYLPTFYAPVGWTSWKDIAEEYYQAGFTEKGLNADKMTAFYNTILALPFRQASTSNDWRVKFEEAQQSPYRIGEVPDWINFITTGSDVQGNRIETKVIGWGKRGRHLTIDYKVFLVPNDEEITIMNGEAWRKYREEILDGVWEREDGLKMKSIANAMDSSYKPDTIYAFYLALETEERARFFPIKGDDRMTGYMSSQREVKSANLSGAMYWKVPVSAIKHTVFTHLEEKDNEQHNKPFIAFFPSDFNQEFYMQIYSESFLKNGSKYSWIKTRDRNEGLDTYVYNYAMYYLMGLGQLTDEDWEDVAKAQVEALQNVVKTKNTVRQRNRGRVYKGLKL